MSVMSIRIDDDKRKILKLIASIEGKQMGTLISELIEKYIKENKEKLKSLYLSCEINSMMKISEPSFD